MNLKSYAVLLPCGVGLFTGVEFVCCPKKHSDSGLNSAQPEINNNKPLLGGEKNNNNNEYDDNYEDEYDDDEDVEDEDDDDDYDDDARKCPRF